MDGLIAMVVGSFELPESERAGWDARTIDAGRWKDWPEGPMFEALGSFENIGALFASQAESDESVAFLERSFRGERVEISGVLQGEEAILGAHLAILCAAREAAELGGRGKLAIVLPAFDGATTVTLDGKKRSDQSTVEMGPAAQAFADEALARLTIAIQGWLNDKSADPALRRGPWSAGEARFWLDETPSEHERAALEGARSLSDAELAAALADDAVLAPSLAPLRTEGDLRKHLADGTPLARAVAIMLFAHARGDAAVDTAIALSTARSKYLARMALRSLAWGTTDDALAALERGVFSESSECVHAIAGLAQSRAAGADARIDRLLSGPDFDLTRDDREQRFARAQRILELAGERGRRDHLGRLFALFEDPKARLVIPQIVRALARVGGDAVEARAEELQYAMLGMGRALNQDHARRAELLRIEDEESGGIVRYDDLELDRLIALLEEGFIHPESRQNDAPSTIEMLGIMQEFPEVRASGYAVVPSRPDYRVQIDGLSAELKGLPAERAADLRALFEQLGETATNTEIENDVVSAWWT